MNEDMQGSITNLQAEIKRLQEQLAQCRVSSKPGKRYFPVIFVIIDLCD